MTKKRAGGGAETFLAKSASASCAQCISLQFAPNISQSPLPR
jgi:hypothetical protein